MRVNFGVRPWSYPQPVFIIGSYDENHRADAMTLTWGGIYSEKEIHLYLSNDHKTTENILNRREFTVSMADTEHIDACDYVGIASGKDTPDKLERAGFHTSKAEFVDAPLINELPMALECRMISYSTESCHMIAEIINVNADESILSNGQIDPEKLHPITVDTINNVYIGLGAVVGEVYSVGMKLHEGRNIGDLSK